MSGILAQGARFHLGVRPKTMRLPQNDLGKF